jgi:predicted ATPase
LRVDVLHLKDYKNLRDFTVDFHITSSRQVVVGRNGVGKSNLLEALAWIFRELDLEEEASFAYTIVYHCNQHYVRIDATERKRRSADDRRRYVRTYEIAPANGQVSEDATKRQYMRVTQTDFYRRNRNIGANVNPDRVLPHYVFGYYSGVSERFHEAFARHEEKYYREQITGEEAPLRPLFLAKSHHSQFALLSFFAAGDEKAKRFLREEFRIEGLKSVLFALHEPYWSKTHRPNSGQGPDDARFWRTGGKVAPFLDSLFRHSLAPMSGAMKRRISLGQEKTFGMRYCFVPDEGTLRELAGGLESKEFFARLESTIFSDLVSTDGQDVRIRVSIRDQPEPVTFQELSEGEQQLLTIIGLMRFTAQREGLFLLDEPDTHLNPAWCLDYLSNLREYGFEPPDSQIIMTTHSPLTFAGLEKDEVVVFLEDENGSVTARHPTSAPRGMGFQAILTSEFFGLRSGIDPVTLVALDRKRELGLKEDKTEAEMAELARLDHDLGKLDFSRAARDPLYLEYIRAMTAAQEEEPALAAPAPDTTDWRLRQEVARRIAKQLLQKQGADEVH